MMNNNIFGMLNMLMQNPSQFLAQRGINIPNNINDPQAIIQHLLNTGQITQDQVNNAQQMKNSPMFKGLFNK